MPRRWRGPPAPWSTTSTSIWSTRRPASRRWRSCGCTRPTGSTNSSRISGRATVLHFLNEALHRHESDRFATVVFAFLDLRSGWELAVSCGGHPLPLLRTAAGVVPVGTTGRLLGPFPDWDGDTTRVALSPGDLVLFYSDGVTEARRNGEEFGSERLSATLAETDGADAARTVEAVARAVDRFATTPTDDVATLALRVAPVTPAG